jgi:hypothetical protein
MNILTSPYLNGLTNEERAKGEELRTEFLRLVALRVSVSPDRVVQRHRECRDAFTASPTDENFAALKHASFEKRFFRVESQSKSIVHGVLKHFSETQIVPWAKAILERALSNAREQLSQITKDEDARHRSLTGGRPLTVSGLVETAKQPVKQIEQWLAQLSQESVRAGNAQSDIVQKIFDMFAGDGPLVRPVGAPDTPLARELTALQGTYRGNVNFDSALPMAQQNGQDDLGDDHPHLGALDDPSEIADVEDVEDYAGQDDDGPELNRKLTADA